MKVIICCSDCGNENLELVSEVNPYKYLCPKCNLEFDIDFSGFNIHENGKISDGSHTFDELYYHRMILFSIICNINSQRAWKSWKHHDGTMFDNYFIVGITTPRGDFTYHYHEDCWDYFYNVKELEHAPKWDGHQSDDIVRLLSLL